MASESPLKKYSRYLVYTGVGLGILSSFALYSWPGNVHPLWFIVLLFVMSVQWLTFAFVVKFAQHKTQTMLRQYQNAKFAKLLIYFIVLAAYVFAVKTNAMTFLINFIVYYAAFTVLEAWYFHRWINTLPTTKDIEKGVE
ncbi:MAG: hypothetical protein LBP96_03760 [Bacteroidales bacterium]|jgi:uncharacterized membrane protein (Fun14 family)|nr:hypothetical protein [Bacteroidales bacterium]